MISITSVLLLACPASAFLQPLPNLQRLSLLYSSTDLESEIKSMRAGAIKHELESYGISTIAFLEKSELIYALVHARKERNTQVASPSTSDGSTATTIDAETTTTLSPEARKEKLDNFPEAEHCAPNTSDTSASSGVATLAHSDIEWKLRSPQDTSKLNRLKLKLGADILILDAKFKNGVLPPVLCPSGGHAVLEAYYKKPGKRKKKIARFEFDITPSRVPSCYEKNFDTTIRKLYSINPQHETAWIAVIINIFVEPEYRKLGVGSLALEVISAIHSIQGVDYTVLVADDNGTGRLVKWYESNGFSKAPLILQLLGSPRNRDGKFNMPMIRPVDQGWKVWSDDDSSVVS